MRKRGWIWRASLAAGVAGLELAAAHVGSAQTTSYSYDALGRLQLAAQSNGTGASYVYDSAGNRTQRTSCSGGVFLASGRLLTSSSGQYSLVMQATDGNLVVYGPGGAIWAANTGGHPGAYAAMRANGTLAVYNPQGTVLWVSDNFEGPCASIFMQNDGNLVIYDTTGAPRWASNNASLTSNDRMLSGQQMLTGEQLVSADGRFSLQYQNNGKLVLLGPGNATLWTSPATNTSPGAATMQTNGALVINGAGGAVWSTGTSKAGSYVVMQTDGNLVIYAPASAGGGALWQSGTGGH